MKKKTDQNLHVSSLKIKQTLSKEFQMRAKNVKLGFCVDILDVLNVLLFICSFFGRCMRASHSRERGRDGLIRCGQNCKVTWLSFWLNLPQNGIIINLVCLFVGFALAGTLNIFFLFFIFWLIIFTFGWHFTFWFWFKG